MVPAPAVSGQRTSKEVTLRRREISFNQRTIQRSSLHHRTNPLSTATINHYQDVPQSCDAINIVIVSK